MASGPETPEITEAPRRTWWFPSAVSSLRLHRGSSLYLTPWERGHAAGVNTGPALGPSLPGLCWEDLKSLPLSFISALEIEISGNWLMAFEVYTMGLGHHGIITELFWHFRL